MTEGDITITGATKGALSGSGLTRTLTISAITVADSATVSVEVASPTGFMLTGSPQRATVHRSLAIGMDYLGGKIAYFLVPSDPGYDANVAHGLIAANADQAGSTWALPDNDSRHVPTFTSIGSGLANTNAIVLQNGAANTYAAGLCDAYENPETGTGVYSDWYLPSIDELAKLYLNRSTIGGLTGSSYWSSSEDSNASYAFEYRFTNGTVNNSIKYAASMVRPVRSF